MSSKRFSEDIGQKVFRRMGHLIAHRALALSLLLFLFVSRSGCRADVLVFHQPTPWIPAQCDSVNLTWAAGFPNFTITITSPEFAPTTITNIADHTALWVAKACAGTPFLITLSDLTRFEADERYNFTLQGSTNTSCLSEEQATSPQCQATQVSTSLSSTPTSSQSDEATQSNSFPASLVVVPIIGALSVFSVVGWCLYARQRRRRRSEEENPGSTALVPVTHDPSRVLIPASTRIAPENLPAYEPQQLPAYSRPPSAHAPSVLASSDSHLENEQPVQVADGALQRAQPPRSEQMETDVTTSELEATSGYDAAEGTADPRSVPARSNNATAAPPGSSSLTREETAEARGGQPPAYYFAQ